MELAYAYGPPPARAILRQRPEDFIVEEDLGFGPEGEGEHLWLWVEKRNLNTEAVARRLAQLARVRPGDVSYAGLKDRHAVTRQWFGIHAPKGDVQHAADWCEDDWHVLRAARAHRKLRRGSLRGNRFIIMLRRVDGDSADIEARLRQIATRGVPNYFGEQRFGHANLDKAEAMVSGVLRVPDRHLRGIYLSSLRSAIFNAVLDRRVRDGSWETALAGEALNLTGSRSFFVADSIDTEIQRRLTEHDIHPTGPLFGKGELPSRAQARVLEQTVIETCPSLWREGLVAAGMEQERRPLRLCPQGLRWEWGSDGQGQTLRLEFSLPAGAYATVVIRETISVSD